MKLAGNLYLMLAARLTINYVTSLPALKKALLAWLTGTAATVVASISGLILFSAGARTARTNPVLSHFGSLPPGPYPRIRGLFLNANAMCTLYDRFRTDRPDRA